MLSGYRLGGECTEILAPSRVKCVINVSRPVARRLVSHNKQ